MEDRIGKFEETETSTELIENHFSHISMGVLHAGFGAATQRVRVEVSLYHLLRFLHFFVLRTTGRSGSQ